MGLTSPALPVGHDQPLPIGIMRRSPRREVLLAGIPHLWFGLAVMLGNLAQDHYRLGPGLSTVVLALFLVSSAGVAVFAWRRAWPLWTAAWYSYAFWLLVVAIAYLVNLLGNDNWIFNSVIALGSVAAIGLAYMFLFRFSRLHALLVALFLVPVAAQLGLESIPEAWEAFIALFFGLMAALASAYAVRTLNWSQGVKAALLANLCAGAVLTYVCFYQTEIPGFYGTTSVEAWMTFLGYLGVAAALFLGPGIFWGGWDMVRGKLR